MSEANRVGDIIDAMATKKPQPNSVEELVLFAEKGMGWEIDRCDAILPDGSKYCLAYEECGLPYWNPRRSIADAVELAKRLGIEFSYRVNKKGGIDMKHEAASSGHFIAWGTRAHKDKESPCGPICNASLEYLTREGQDALG